MCDSGLPTSLMHIYMAFHTFSVKNGG